jgi:hypothetical protein
MNNTNTPITNELYDGPFKMPFPRKSLDSTNSRQNKLRIPKPQYKQIDNKYQRMVYQKLLVKLLQTPDTMTKFDMKILATHPIIRKLLKKSKGNSCSSASFYVPIETLLNPHLYINTEVPVFYESSTDVTRTQQTDQKISEDVQDEDMANDSTSSNHDADEVAEKRIGIYTQKERQERIRKYKQKLQRFRDGKSSHPTKKNCKNGLSKNQPRKNGKFSTYPDVTESLLDIIHSKNNTPSSSCSNEFLQIEKQNECGNLNDLVSEITGIF